MNRRLSIWAESWDLCGAYMEWVGFAFLLVFGIVLAICIGVVAVFVFIVSLCVVLLGRGVDWSLRQEG